MTGEGKCKNGHDLSVHGRLRRHGPGRVIVRCIQCEREGRRNTRKCREGHVIAEVGWVPWRGKRRCAACIENDALQSGDAQPPESWFDWVVARRVGRGEKPGRRLSAAEFDECMRAYGKTLTPTVLAQRMGSNLSRVQRWLESRADDCYSSPPWWAEVRTENPRQALNSAA